MGPAGVVVAMAVSVGALLPTGGGGSEPPREPPRQEAPAPGERQAEPGGGQGAATPAPDGPRATPAPAVVPGAAERLLALVNAERSAAGLRPLEHDPRISTIAVSHSLAMAGRGDIFHNDGYFTTAVRRELGAGALGENVARNTDLTDAHRRLMASPHHQANILDPRFSVAGFAVVGTGDGVLYITEDFAELRPRAAVVAAAGARPPAPVAAARPAPGVAAAPGGGTSLRLVPVGPAAPAGSPAAPPVGALAAVVVVLAVGALLPIGGRTPATARVRSRSPVLRR